MSAEPARNHSTCRGLRLWRAAKRSVLPSAAWVEREGVFGNSERRTQHWEKAVDPPGEATEDAWQIPHSTRVDGITNFQHTWADGDELIVEDLVGPGEITPAIVARARDALHRACGVSPGAQVGEPKE